MISDELWGLFVLVKALELGYRKLSVQLLYSEMKDCKNRRENDVKIPLSSSHALPQVGCGFQLQTKGGISLGSVTLCLR